MPTDDNDRMTPAPVGSKVGRELALSDTGVVMPSHLGDMIDFAQIMCKSDVAIPKHLRGNPGACLAVAMRARAWMMDPFAIATKTYAVNDILAYESQLITAVINRHAPIKGRLVPRYVGSGGDRQCHIEAETLDGQVLPYESPKVKDIGVKNSPLWKNDPDQQLFYSSARAWARRYFPELLLGVYDRDEAVAMKDVTPAKEVENYLNDEGEAPEMIRAKPLEGEIQPATLNGKHIKRGGESVMAGDIPQGTVATFDQETGEITDVEEASAPIPPETIAGNMLKAAKGFSSAAMLESWVEESRTDIAALPDEWRGKIEKAIAARRKELAEEL